MDNKLPAEVVKIAKVFFDRGFEIYIVGGAVRDLLMGKPVYDWDFTTNATPQEILSLFPQAFYDNAFGTVGIPSGEPDTRPHEVTTYRKEFGYTDSRRPDKVEWGKTLKEDLERRDFTINSMAIKIADYDTEKTELIDPFDGQSDMKQGLVRAVGDPNERFTEDALRMMRAIRIAAQINFRIEESTFNAIKANTHLIHKIAKERVRDELLKIFASPHPYEGMMLFKESGLMNEILPEMEATFGVEQKSPGRHHIYDVGTHSLFALKNTKSTDPIVRFATFIHDIGKPLTYKKLSTGTITFYNHEIVGARIAAKIAQRLRLSNRQADLLWKLVRFHQFTVDERQTDSAIRRFIRNVGKEDVPAMLDLRVADRLGGGARETSWRLEEFKSRLIEVQKQPFTIRDLKISGNDIMKELNIGPRPKVGEILKELFDKVVEKKIENDRDTLLDYIKTKTSAS